MDYLAQEGSEILIMLDVVSAPPQFKCLSTSTTEGMPTQHWYTHPITYTRAHYYLPKTSTEVKVHCLV